MIPAAAATTPGRLRARSCKRTGIARVRPPAFTPSPWHLHLPCPATVCNEADQNRKFGGMAVTSSDLIVLAPWVVFGVGVAVICYLIIRWQRR